MNRITTFLMTALVAIAPMASLASPIDALTARETAVAKLISSGRTYEEVSEELSIAHSTIKNILQKVKEKLKLSSSKDIAKLFVATL